MLVHNIIMVANLANPRIYLSAPEVGEQERVLVSQVLEPGKVPPPAMHVEEFENEVAAYTGAKAAVAVSSGTAAIHLALRLIGVTQGDVVFCSSFTFIASANPILYLGARPVFIDSEPETWNLSPSALERALEKAKQCGKLPKALVVVNLYGQSAEMDQILALCRQFKVTLIEDAAESLGASYKGKPSGCFGRIGIYSFNGNKIITTFGGGMLVSDEPELMNKARFWATQARDVAPHYQHSEMGYNYRMSSLSAGMGRAQFRTLGDRVEARRRIFDRYRKELSDLPGIQFMPEPEHMRSTRWLSTLLLPAHVPSKLDLSSLIQKLSDENIEARPLWKPLHLQPLFEANEYHPHIEGRSFCDELFRSGVCLPSSSNLMETEQDRVIEALRRIIKRHS